MYWHTPLFSGLGITYTQKNPLFLSNSRAQILDWNGALGIGSCVLRCPVGSEMHRFDAKPTEIQDQLGLVAG